METYFPNSNEQRDAEQMLYLREPSRDSYSDATVLPRNIMMTLNYSSSSGSYADALSGNTQQQNNNIDVSSIGISSSNLSPNLGGGSRVEEHDFSTWRDDRNEMLFMPPVGNADEILQNAQYLQGQGLSLSLGSKMVSSNEYSNPNLGFSSFMSPNPSFSGSNTEPMRSDISPFGVSTIARNITNSKYVKAVQQLLDEVVNVMKALKNGSKNETAKDSKENDGGSSVLGTPGESSNLQEPTNISASVLTAAEKQELQNKLTKLLSMLDEVGRGYRQYYHQMHIVASSFDATAGNGAAKTYTALALQTISCHFRCLRDAINGQIELVRKNLGEQDSSVDNNSSIVISRLRYVDQKLRQQRAVQQFGMMQPHAWRPQRGLPENSVTILRAWLFEHFLHPYPKDSDKTMLARQTGLTRSQVSNWFINARVRLWKPMVEEMYKEEIGDVEMDSISSSETEKKDTNYDHKSLKDIGEDLKQSSNSNTTEPYFSRQDYDPTSKHTYEAETVGPSRDQMPSSDNNTGFFSNTIFQPKRVGERFMEASAAAYHMGEIESFENGGGDVSLTLGLHHRQNGGLSALSIDNSHHGFVGTMRGNDDVYNAVASVETETSDFECLDSGNRQQQRSFGPSHLLHDFVA